MKINNKGFTVVELVTVIIIIIILGTIGFVSYGGYLIGVRDTNRISQISGINKALNSYQIKAPLPLPDDYVTVEVAGGVIGYQGNAGKQVLKDIGFKKGGVDPLDGEYYTYYVTKNRKHSQMMTLLEKEQIAYNPVNKSYAAGSNYEERIIHVFGKQLGVLTEDITNNPIHKISTIKIAKKLNLTVENTRKFRSSFRNKDFIVSEGINLVKLRDVSELGGEGCTAVTGEIVCSVDTVSIKIKGDDTIGRQWANGTAARTCNEYRKPQEGYTYAGDIGNGIYKIATTVGSQKNVYCDMRFDLGGWTLATKYTGSAGQNSTLFKPSGGGTSDTYVGFDTYIANDLSVIWPSDVATKDIMIKCKVPDNAILNDNYGKPFVIKDFKYSEIANLENPSYNSTISIVNLNAIWDGNINTLKTRFEGDFKLKNNVGFKYTFKLDGGTSLMSFPTADPNSPAYSTSNESQTLDNDNFCITAIR